MLVQVQEVSCAFRLGKPLDGPEEAEDVLFGVRHPQHTTRDLLLGRRRAVLRLRVGLKRQALDSITQDGVQPGLERLPRLVFAVSAAPLSRL